MTSLVDQYKQLHNEGRFPGNSFKKEISYIKTLIDETNSKGPFLDYGSGKGLQYSAPHELHHELGLINPPVCYDPGVKKFENLPSQKFQGIWSTDVFEHLEDEVIHKAIQYMAVYAENFIYLAIHCSEAKQILPDGRNAHINIKTPEEWRDFIFPQLDLYTSSPLCVIRCYAIPNREPTSFRREAVSG